MNMIITRNITFNFLIGINNTKINYRGAESYFRGRGINHLKYLFLNNWMVLLLRVQLIVFCVSKKSIKMNAGTKWGNNLNSF